MPKGISHWVADDATYRPDRYYAYAELTALLQAWQRTHPNLMTLESIGSSYEGRDIWAVTLTNSATGHHAEKPAAFVDANIHAGEVTGCSTVLWLLNHLLTTYGNDERTTRLLDESTLYAVPAIMVDGMDAYLTSANRMRSSVRAYPEPEQQDGLYRKDMDGDGRLLQMRVRDENGPWKEAPDDPRVMIRREPDEHGGTYFFVFEEGEIKNWDGGAVKVSTELLGLDLNRNFPHAWVPEWEQRGAGALPLSEPETRAIAEFLDTHQNIGATQHFHTWSGVILRPSSNLPDQDLPAFDLRMYKTIGKMGEEETGYTCVSIHHGFAYDKKKPIHGAVLDWVYDTFGAYAYSTELWSLPQKAGIEIDDLIEWGHDHPPEQDVQMARALDEYANGEGIYPWKPFDHPQLGEVEIGGWDYKFAKQNPPGNLLEDVTTGNATFVIREMGTLPRIVFGDVTAERIADGVYKIAALVQNTGFLPTWISERGKATKRIKGVEITIALPEGAGLVSGNAKAEMGHLEGRANSYGPMNVPAQYGNLTRGRVEWIVSAEAGSTIELTATSTKAGTVRTSVELG